MKQSDYRYNNEPIPNDILLDALIRFEVNESGNMYCDLEKIQENIQKAYIIGRMDERTKIKLNPNDK